MYNKLLYKIAAGLMVTAVLFYFSNFIYVKTGDWQKDLNKLEESGMLQKTDNTNASADILYFGESSNFTKASTDTNQQTISEIINNYFPELKIVAVDRGAIHAGVYKELIKRIKKDSKIKSIIVTMNLRSFNSDWRNSDQENGCQELRVVAQEYPELLRKMMLVLKAYDYKEDWKRQENYRRDMAEIKLNVPAPLTFKTVQQWDSYVADNLYRDSNGVADYSTIALACHNVKSFAFNIDTLNNPRIKDFDEIVKICKEKNINVYFNLLAENIQYADSLVGKELVTIMKQNRDLLVDRYSRKGAIVIDNLEAVKDGKCFVDQHWTTEHYDQTGRKIIAGNVAKRLKEKYSKYYKN